MTKANQNQVTSNEISRQRNKPFHINLKQGPC